MLGCVGCCGVGNLQPIDGMMRSPQYIKLKLFEEEFSRAVEEVCFIIVIIIITT